MVRIKEPLFIQIGGLYDQKAQGVEYGTWICACKIPNYHLVYSAYAHICEQRLYKAWGRTRHAFEFVPSYQVAKGGTDALDR